MINPDEILFSVDEDNNPIEPQTRSLSHQQHLWHRCCHVYIVNSEQQLVLCQKRSMLKDNNAGLWEAFTGGHVLAGQSYVENALDEVKEEIGMDIHAEDLQFIKEAKDERHPQYLGIFKYEWAGDITSLKLEQDEVDDLKWFPVQYVIDHVQIKPDEQWTHFSYSLDFLMA
jgi:8-oxo-dGTP diphosphatase